MDKTQFIHYTASRYGIDPSQAETIIDIFADTLQEIISSGESVSIDEIGEFNTKPMFPNGLNHHNNLALEKIANKHIVSFKPSDQLTQQV